MKRIPTGRAWPVLTAALLALSACGGGDEPADQTAADPNATPAGTQPSAAPAPTPPPPPPDLRLEVDVGKRELRVYRNDQLEATHPVAVGMPEWPTKTGEWTIGQVVWNPRWTPPEEEEWAKDEEVKEPGAADNPLGRAQLVYDAPRSIHGTNEPASLGKAESHGSIRVANDVAVRLARMVMESGGARKDEAFYTQVRDNRRERVEVAIPNPVPIRVVNGGSGAGSSGDSDDSGDDGEAAREKGRGAAKQR
ncbi:MAG TPA: L,D-transpeptidase [Longimicrobium sp.]|nr:L,D-transpeptidase [Longimicrobium sp.]